MTQPSPTASFGAASRRLAIPAAWAAGGVLAVLLVQVILRNLVLTVAAVGASNPGQFGALWVGQFQQLFLVSLPFALGVFVAFWLLAPIESGTTLPRLALRSLVAVGVGTLAAIAVSVLMVLFGSLFGFNFFGASFPDLGGPLRLVWYSVVGSVSSVLNLAVTVLPTVILAALLTQLWLRRRGAGASHPASPPTV